MKTFFKYFFKEEIEVKGILKMLTSVFNLYTGFYLPGVSPRKVERS